MVLDVLGLFCEDDIVVSAWVHYVFVELLAWLIVCQRIEDKRLGACLIEMEQDVTFCARCAHKVSHSHLSDKLRLELVEVELVDGDDGFVAVGVYADFGD